MTSADTALTARTIPPDSIDRRVIFTGPGEVQWEEGPVADPGPGEVLLRTRCSLISTGTGLAQLAGPPWTNPDGRTLPRYPSGTGYSNAGVVLAIGPGVTTSRPGDRIASGARHAAYPVIRERDWAIPIPDGVSDEDATFCTLATTVMNGFRLGTPQLGEDAVVLGQGILGHIVGQYLRLVGCRSVVAVDVADSRLEVSRRAGAATHWLNPQRDAAAAAVRDLTGGRGADVVYEATGRTETYDLAFALARFYGRVVGLGSPRWPAPVDMMQVHMKSLRVLGAIVSSHPSEDNRDNRWSRRANGHYVMELLARRQLNVRDLITHRFPAADAPDVYARLLEKRTDFLGVILQWQT
ncbi:MAG: zinc-binding dehydrogenase [Chloroflexi bacterium]|nr:zinc-binding dehydrogenase [Chloroflexota bacterium]